MSHPQRISLDSKILLIISESIQIDQLILNVPRLFSPGINSRRYSYIWHKYNYGTTAMKRTYANLKAKLLQSDKNQVSIPNETALVNEVTSSSVPESSPPVALDVTTPSMDPLNLQLTPAPSMCGQLKSTHPARCLNNCVPCSACGIVGHELVFCRKVIALTRESTSVPSRNRQKITRKSPRNKKIPLHPLKMINLQRK